MDSMDRGKLGEHNGQEGRKAFVAFDGKIYDVSDSPKWKNGKHMMRHSAGLDLSVELKAAPHGAEVFEKVPQVAVLSREDAKDEGPTAPRPLSWIYAKFPIVKRHSHPVSVHYPIAFLMGSLLFCLIYLATKNQFFESTAFHLLVLGTVTAPVAILTGLQSWWLYYGTKRSVGITVKLICGPALVVAGAIASILHIANPDILLAGGSGAMLYLALVGLCTPIALVLGYIGGQMVFPD